MAQPRGDRQPDDEGMSGGAEYPEGKFADESSRGWSGYRSDQGEPGDTEELEAEIPDDRAADASVRADVCRHLESEPDLDTRDVAVDVVGGEVVLQGSVGGEEVRRRIERIAREAPGARSVRNELEIRRGELEPPEERSRVA